MIFIYQMVCKWQDISKKAWHGHCNNAIDIYSTHHFVLLIYKKYYGLKFNPVCAKSLPLISSGFQWNALTLHSEWEKLLQVMKGSRRNPLTPGRWVHMWLKNGIFKKIWLGYLTNKFSKTKTVPIWPHFSTNIVNIFVLTSMINSIWVKNKVPKTSRVICGPFSTLKIAKKCQKSPFWLIWS